MASTTEDKDLRNEKTIENAYLYVESAYAYPSKPTPQRKDPFVIAVVLRYRLDVMMDHPEIGGDYVTNQVVPDPHDPNKTRIIHAQFVDLATLNKMLAKNHYGDPRYPKLKLLTPREVFRRAKAHQPLITLDQDIHFLGTVRALN